MPNPGILTEQIPPQTSSTEGSSAVSDSEIVQILEGYRTEAEYTRLSGPNSRDMTWLTNLDLYWNRFDFSEKAPWQAREVMPELPQYVDRFAAAMRTALMGSDYFFTVKVNNDDEKDMADVVRKVIMVQLKRCARSPSGHPIDFSNVFEELVKMASLMMFSCVISVKDEGKGHYVAVDPVDPYNIWLDPTGRGLYRIRRIEIDLHELMRMAEDTDVYGKAIYNRDAIMQCQAAAINALMRAEREKRTGTGQWVYSTRIPVVLHEYRATLITPLGDCIGENVLCVVANNDFLIRGPEKNPFWHMRDWVVTAPIITVPMSPYGKTYVENFASIARTFNELTNLILDGVFTSAMKAFVAVPSLLEDPSQIDEGVHPNVVFRALEGNMPADVLKEFSLGQLSPDAIQIWGSLKRELQEGAAFNEIALGQLAQHSRTSATEVGTAESNSNSFLKSIATNIETLFVEPLLDIFWKTTIQHLDRSDKEILDAVGEDWFNALLANKRQFCDLQVTFICRGISSLIQKGQKLQQLMQYLQVIGSNQILAQAFLQEVSPDKLNNYIADLLDIDRQEINMSDREKQIKQIEMQSQQAAAAAQGAVPGQAPTPGGPQTAGPAGGQGPSQGAAQRQLPQSAGGIG